MNYGMKNINIGKINPAETLARKDKANGAKPGEFESLLKGQLEGLKTSIEQKGQSNELKFSSHAIQRMQSRGVTFTPDDKLKIEQAIEQARAKGSKDSVVLTDNEALVVSVKNNTVVTVMGRDNLKNNVFTNIDSMVMV